MALAEVSPNRPSARHSLLVLGGSTPGEAWATYTTPSQHATSFPPPVPPLPLSLAGEGEGDGLSIRKRENRKSLPANSTLVNCAPGIADRRKSTRTRSIYIERVSVGGTTTVRSAKGSRPRFPVKVDSESVPALASQLAQSPIDLDSPTSMASSPDEASSPLDTATSVSWLLDICRRNRIHVLIIAAV